MFSAKAVITGPDIETVWDQKDTKKVVEHIRRTIRRRTAEGRGADGKPFAPYSPQYAQKHPGNPDLNESGRLMESLSVEVQGDDGSVSTSVTYAEAVDARRPFLGIAPDEVEELDRLVEELFDEHVNEKKVRNG